MCSYIYNNICKLLVKVFKLYTYKEYHIYTYMYMINNDVYICDIVYVMKLYEVNYIKYKM